MPGVTLDGNDVLDVYHAAAKAVKRARAGEGPTLIECKTYRWRGHHEGDPNQGERYRTKDEIQEWKDRCPIVRFSQKLIDDKVATKKKLSGIEKEVAAEIDAAVAFARESEFPAVEEMYEDVFV
jgi:pyruvate dehydrogenase E1 component alpha subunit